MKSKYEIIKIPNDIIENVHFALYCEHFLNIMESEVDDVDSKLKTENVTGNFCFKSMSFCIYCL